MLSSGFTKSISDRARATIITITIIVVYAFFAVGAYSTMSDSILDIYDQMPPGLAAIYGTNDGTVVGLATGALFGFIAPIVVITYAVAGGVGAAVGEERKGSLDLLLSNPVSRSGVAVPKAIVAALGTAIIGLGTWASIYVTSAIFADGIGDLDIFAATLMMIALGLMFGGLAMAIAGWFGSSGLAIGVTTGIAVISWFITTVLAVEESLATLSTWTPWYLYSGADPVFEGIGWWQLAVMLIAGAVLATLGVVGVNRRDLRG